MNRILLASIPLFFVLGARPIIASGQTAASVQTEVVAASAVSAGSCDRMQYMTGLQRRLVAKAAQGTDALRDFIFITRGVYQLDMGSIVAWLDRERSAERVCVATTLAAPVAVR